MSTLGKVLLFLNLLAAGGLIYVATQDWAKRQEISGIVLRYQLTLQGLPLETPTLSEGADANVVFPVDVQTKSGLTITQVNKKVLNDQFNGAGGGDKYGAGSAATVTSLLDELNRAEKKLLTDLNAIMGNEGKLRFLAGGLDARGLFAPGLLLTMAESYAEREAIRALAYPPPPTEEAIAANLKDAQQRLATKVSALKAAPNPKALAQIATTIDNLRKDVEKNPADTAAKAKIAAISGQGAPPFTRNDSDRRRRMALFLMLLDSTKEWQKRVMIVTGLKTYQEALNEQVARVTDITRQTERAIESDQATYEREYEQLKRLAIEQDLLVVDEAANVKGLAEMVSRDSTSRNARKAQLDVLETELAGFQKTIAEVLGKQAAAEEAVFGLQRKVGDTLRGNLDLEAKLDQTEQGK